MLNQVNLVPGCVFCILDVLMDVLKVSVSGQKYGSENKSVKSPLTVTLNTSFKFLSIRLLFSGEEHILKTQGTRE